MDGGVDSSIVSEISEKFNAQDIFRAKLWRDEEALLFLVGVHREKHFSESFSELQLLDGRVLRDPLDTEVIERIYGRVERLRWVFERSRKMGRHRPQTYIKWGLEEKAISNIGWVDDAVRKGFLNKEALVGKSSVDKDVLDIRERHSLYKIIFALMHSPSKNPKEHGYYKWLVGRLEVCGVPIRKAETVSKHVDAVTEYCKGVCDKDV